MSAVFLLLYVGRFGQLLTPPRKSGVEWMVSNAELTNVGHNLIKVLKKKDKQREFSQTDIFLMKIESIVFES